MTHEETRAFALKSRDKVKELYLRGKTFREICIETGFSHNKCKKLLIDQGLIKTKEQEMLENGYTLAQIAEATGQSIRSVNNKVGYSKCVYKSDTPTANAERIRRWRSKESKI